MKICKIFFSRIIRSRNEIFSNFSPWVTRFKNFDFIKFFSQGFKWQDFFQKYHQVSKNIFLYPQLYGVFFINFFSRIKQDTKVFFKDFFLNDHLIGKSQVTKWNFLLGNHQIQYFFPRINRFKNFDCLNFFYKDSHYKIFSQESSDLPIYIFYSLRHMVIEGIF